MRKQKHIILCLGTVKGGISLNSRERLLTVLHGEIPDRVPVSPFVQEEFLSYMFPNEVVDRIKSAVKCAEHFDFDVMARHRLFYDYPHFIKKSYKNWEIKEKKYIENGYFYEVFQIITPEKTLEQIEVRPNSDYLSSTMPMTKKYIIGDRSDLEVFKKYFPALDKDSIDKMKTFLSWAKVQIGNRGLSAPWGLSVFNLAARFRNIENLLIDPFIDEEFYIDYMNTLTNICIKYDYLLSNANREVISFHGNIANSGLIGKDFFENNVLPYEQKVVEAIHQAGSYTLYHNCGKADILQESYVKMGLTAWETVAETPRGDNELKKAKTKIGDKIVLVGNLDQVDFLKNANRNEIYENVERIMQIGKPGGRYIFSCSDYLEKETPLENVKAMIDSAKEFGKY